MTQSDLFTLILTEAAKAGVREMQCELATLSDGRFELDMYTDIDDESMCIMAGEISGAVPLYTIACLAWQDISKAPPIVAKVARKTFEPLPPRLKPETKMPRIAVILNGHMLADDVKEATANSDRFSESWQIRAGWMTTDQNATRNIEGYAAWRSSVDVILTINGELRTRWPKSRIESMVFDREGISAITIVSELGSIRIVRSKEANVKKKPTTLADVLPGKAELPGPVTPSTWAPYVRSRLANAFLGTDARHFRSDALLDNVIVDAGDGVEIGRIPRDVIENGTDEELRAEVWCSDCGKTYANQISKCRRDGQTVCGDCLGPVVVIHKAQTVGATRVITSAEEYERLYGRKPDPSLFAPRPLMFLPLPDHAVTEDRTYHIEELTIGRKPHGYVCSCWLCELGTNGPWHEHEAASRVDYGGECAKAAGYGLRTFIAGAMTERDCWPEDNR